MRDVLNRLSRFAETWQREEGRQGWWWLGLLFRNHGMIPLLSRLSTPRGTLQCHHVSMFPLLGQRAGAVK